MKESAMLYDPEAGIDREVDILVESTVLNCSLKIGIECSAEKRPMDVRKIEGFREKHRKLGINKTIVVSNSGFAKPAKDYARKVGIKLLTFNSAKSENWTKNFERLRGLSMYARNYFLRKVSVTMPAEVDQGFVLSLKTIVTAPNLTLSLHEFIGHIFESSEISKKAAKELRENEAGGSDPWVEIGFDLKGDYLFTDEEGRKVSPKDIVIVMGYKSNYRNLGVRQVQYDGQDMVVGGFFDKKSKESAHIAVRQSDNKYVATVEVSGALFPK